MCVSGLFSQGKLTLKHLFRNSETSLGSFVFWSSGALFCLLFSLYFQRPYCEHYSLYQLCVSKVLTGFYSCWWTTVKSAIQLASSRPTLRYVFLFSFFFFYPCMWECFVRPVFILSWWCTHKKHRHSVSVALAAIFGRISVVLKFHALSFSSVNSATITDEILD